MRERPTHRIIGVWMRGSVGVAHHSQGMDAGDAMGELGMNDARFDRTRTGDASGEVRPDELAPNHSEGPDFAPTRDWTRMQRRRSTSSMLVHWFDEKGAVVRLIASTDPTATGTDA